MVAAVADRVLGLAQVIAAEAPKETAEKLLPRKAERGASGLARLCCHGVIYFPRFDCHLSRMASLAIADVGKMVNASLFYILKPFILLDRPPHAVVV